MSAETREEGQADVAGLQALGTEGFPWLHVPVPGMDAITALDVGTAIPASVIDTLCEPPPRPQRTLAQGWTVWTLRPVGFQLDPAVVNADHLVIAVGPTAVLTSGQLPAAISERLAERAHGTGLALASTGGAIAATILSEVLEDAARVIACLDDEVEDIETAVFAPGRASHAERIYRLKREVHTVRRCIGPLPELLSMGILHGAEGEARESDRDGAELPARSRRLVEQLAHTNDLLDGVLAAHLTQVAIQQNDDMRRISAWVAIVAAPTAIASIYGMNFRYMPGLDWRLGFPLVLLAMLAICVGLYRSFRRSGWL